MYKLIMFPEVQALMNYRWFTKECFLAQPINDNQNWVGSSAYFVPIERINNLNKSKKQ